MNIIVISVKAEDYMNIAVAGTGYVGMSMATLIAQKHKVVAVECKVLIVSDILIIGCSD